MRVKIIPMVVDVLGTVPKSLKKGQLRESYPSKLKWSVRILRKVLEIRQACHSKSSEKLSKEYDNKINDNSNKREEEDLPALKTALTHPYIDSKIIYKNTKEDSLQPPDTKNKRMTVTRKQKWEGKQLYGRFKRLINNISHDKTWHWLRKGNLKRETESLLIAAQDNAIRTNHIKARIDKTQQNSKCRLCGDRDETINHIISECIKLAQREYKARHDWVGKVIHWEMCKKF